MSLILKCSVCDAKLPNQYAPVGGRCGGYVCKVEEAEDDTFIPHNVDELIAEAEEAERKAERKVA